MTKDPSSLSNDQKRILSQMKIPMDVSPFEAEFIKKLRQYSHGRVTAVLLDGIPVRIETNISEFILPDEIESGV